ncbi:MAG TPA: hypothetical protein VK647_15560 [Gemmatimonadales bacterium]|nr:hypothetical protein [Gemmatimonadales bacterium]
MIGYEGAPRYPQAILALTGDDQIVPPGITLETDRPEFKFIGRVSLAAAFAQAVSGAGTLPEIMLYNPPPPQGQAGSLVVVTRIRFSSTTVNFIAYAFVRAAAPPAGYADTATEGPVDTRDPRVIAARVMAARMMVATPAAPDGGSSFDQVTPQALVTYEDLQPIVLGPGTGLQLRQGPVGVSTLTASFRWYERGLRQEEVNP